MTQYILAPQSGIQTRVGSNGGPTITSVASVVQARQARFDELAGLGGQVAGTFSNGLIVSSGSANATNPRYWKLRDAEYNAILALNASAFAADTVVTSITTETVEAATFLPPNYFNTGLHRQLCIMTGDSIFASGVGASLYNGVGALWNYNDFQPVVSQYVATPNKASWGGYYNLTDGTASSGLQATIGGTITAGNTPSLTFTSSALTGSPINIPYTVQAGDSTTLIAAGLAANINANANLAAAGISATSALAVITLTLPEPPTFTPALQTTKTNSGTATITLAAQTAVNPGGKYTAVTGPSADFNDYVFTNQRVKQYSRFCLGMARGGWFFFELAGASGREDGTVTTGGWVNNQSLFKGLHYASAYQQVVFVIELGTNDFNYNAQSGTTGFVPLYGSPTQGTPNLVGNGLTPLITYFKSLVSNCKIVVVTPHARDFGDNTYNAWANAQFVNYAVYLQANKVSLGIDAIVDARTMGGGVYDPGNYTTNTGSVWTRDGWNARYLDGVHQTPYSITTLYSPAVTAALNSLWA